MGMTTWTASQPNAYWTVGVTPMLSISSQSTQYITATITNSESLNPTSASVSFAFLGPYNSQGQAQEAAPTSSTTYSAGAWVANTSYTAQVLVGPNGTVNLGVGTYMVYVKISESPEVPVLSSGLIVVS